MMIMQSSLVDIVQITTNSNPRGNNRIERITPHCIVGQMAAKTCANLKHFKPGGCASANYIIGKDGELLLNVPEERRAWTSGGEKKINGRTGAMNDYKAITFECASDATAPYAFKPVVYEKLIEVCVDICKRHGRKRLTWIATPQEAEAYKVAADEMILTWHRWYAYKSCPGDWMYSRGQDLARQVNARLGGAEIVVPVPVPNTENKTLEEYKMPLIKRGSKGKAVRIWQIIVGVNDDGDFGPATEAATRKFQKAHGLDVDGIVGKFSWAAGLGSV
jgi:peptidoglycan hydrolase-like protein with peptidoglycan-binding domain